MVLTVCSRKGLISTELWRWIPIFLKMAHGVKSLLLKAMDPFFTKKAGGSVVPFKITGTYKHPSFGLDLTGNKETKASKRLQRFYSNSTNE